MSPCLDRGMPPVRIRQAARALVLDEHDNVLLVHFDWDGLEVPGGFWACPGGGIDDGETPEDALRRELEEELGLTDADIGGALWSLTRMFPMVGWDGQAETWYLVRTPHFDPLPRVVLADENVHGVRWFTRDEIQRPIVSFSPRDLSAQIDFVLMHGIPPSPRAIECLR